MSDYQTPAVTERIKKLRKDLFAAPDRFCFARAEIVTRSYGETEGEPWVLRRAKALQALFKKMPLLIREGELIVGQRAATLAGRSVYPEYHLDDLKQETTPPEIWTYWNGNTLKDEVYDLYPESLLNAERELATAYCTGSGSGFGHVIIDYEKALKRGFRSIAEEARALLEATPEEGQQGRNFLQAVIIVAEGVILWAERHADLAEELARRETEPGRREELERIAVICRRVPALPAGNFHEALQSFWFVHLAMHLEQYGWSISAGRFDQYMYPYYDADLSSGGLSREEAWELLLSLWVKFMENVGTKLKKTIFQNLTLGGQDSSGRDLSNSLSHLCLDASVALKFNQPALSVRWHRKIDPDFWHHAFWTVAQGLGLPALFNDDVIIPALTTHGVSQEDAVGYGIVGCVESCVPGKQQGVTAGGHLNLAKALELALNNGKSLLTGTRIGKPTGEAGAFKSFEDLWSAYVTQVKYLAALDIQAAQIAGAIQKKRGHCPLMSSLLDDCLERRRDLVRGGTRYNLPGISVFGSSNVCDGMTAIKRFVFEQKSISWEHLNRALREDFREQESLRQQLARGAPRFGNDIPEVDAFINRINAVHADFCWSHVDARNGRYTCGVWPVEGHVHTGHQTGASSDGRHAGQPLADGIGACHGADRSGPTALLRSVARLNNVAHWAAGNTCNIKFPKTLIDNQAGLKNLEGLITVYMELGGQQVQINVVDAETLRDAKAHPGRHEDLIVRVAGFSAYFTTLSPDVQDEIISRTEHAL